MSVLRFPVERARPSPSKTLREEINLVEDWFKIAKEICRPEFCVRCGIFLAGDSFGASCRSCAPPQSE